MKVKNNRKIMTFMGGKFINEKTLNPLILKWDCPDFPLAHGKFLSQNELKFDTDWNWLMIVIEMIGNRHNGKMGIFTMYGLNRSKIDCYIGDSRVNGIDIMNNSGLGSTYEAVNEYIEWFNKNN